MKAFKQQDLKDCGACCLLAIIKYYGGNISLEKVRLDTNTNLQGTNALNLIAAAKKYGFDATGVKVDSLQEQNLKFPAIAHLIYPNGLEHFVVVTKIKNNLVYIMDPARGNVTLKEAEFKDTWDNVLLLFYPKMPIVFMPLKNSLFNILGRILSREKKLFLSILIISLFLIFFTIGFSLYFKVILEAINLRQDLSYIKMVIFIFAVILIFKLLFTLMRKSCENNLNKNIDVVLLADFLKHIFHLPLNSIETRTSGEIITRVNELINLKSLFTDIFINLILDLMLGLWTIPFLYALNKTLFWIIFFLVIIYLILGIITSKIIYLKAYNNIELEANFNTVLLEEIKLMPSIKNLDLISEALKKIEAKLAHYLYDNYQIMQFFNIQSNAKMFLKEIGLFLINSYGCFLIYQNKLSIADLITFNTLLTYFFNPWQNIIDGLPKYYFLKASFTKINDFLNIEEEVAGQAIIWPKPEVKIVNLTYSYNNYNLVINNLNTEIKNGEVVLLKGRSGMGKSTLCKILDRYITDYKGEIYFNNINLKDYSLATIRKNITYVSQNEALFGGTIRENIVADRQISWEQFKNVCSVCEIETIIAQKALRYETTINNDSSFISGGERQRIILARSLLKEAPIYLIDEALSEVDYETERRIIKNMQKYLKGKIIIYVTHKNQDDLFKKVLSWEN